MNLNQSTDKVRRIVIYGAGRGARIVVEMLRFRTDIKIVGLVDDDPNLWGKDIFGYKVLGGREILDDSRSRNSLDGITISIASPALMPIRTQIFLSLKEAGFSFINAIHPSAVISPSVILGVNNIISPGVVIETGACLGDNNRLCIHSTIDHDTRIGNNNFIGPNCVISSLVEIGDNCIFELGINIAPLVHVGNNVHIKSKSMVDHSISDNSEILIP